MLRSAFLAAVLVALFAPLASAQIEVGAGYSRLNLSGGDNNLNGVSGFGFDLRAGAPLIPLPVLANLRLGFDLGWRQYVASGSGANANDPDSSDLNLFSGDLRAAWRQPLGIFFIEPSIAGGMLVGAYSTHNHFDASSFDQSAIGWSVRPGLAAGVHLAIFTVGIEANYRWGQLDFRNGAGGDLNEWYAGVFAGLSF